MKILCIGNATWDRIFNVDEIPSKATKYFSTTYHEIGGGVAATAAVAIATLGAEVSLLARLGNDNVGDAITKDLKKWGVDTSLLKQFDDLSSSNAVVHVDPAGERQITVHRDPLLPVNSDWITADFLDGVDCILCDCTWGEGAEKLLNLANHKGIPSVIDADLGGETMEKLVKLGTDIAFSYPALCQMTGETTINKALQVAQQKTTGTVYVTNGEHGCYWIEDGTVKHVPGYSVDVIDTTGAGDVFHGALAFAIANKLSGENAVNFANAVAALKCTKPGGRAGIPNYEQVIQFIKSN
ncbi:PfkB family carbohydrate kinase [Photobacterium sp. DA100]|uniref:PfkB family carbohydrate kinase n=1 Tax=Photobacterium sp. DA100 TaxID=3027472 RepID=UPI00247B24C3|nr:PfkB family carbohydrate kinase [Photobacterium sp. DA100]WEM41178.1 PfkB family carbohydrate kinase [Photobacterium sp. DA100]